MSASDEEAGKHKDQISVSEVVLHYYNTLSGLCHLNCSDVASETQRDILYTIVQRVLTTLDTFLTVFTNAYGSLRKDYDTAIESHCSHKWQTGRSLCNCCA